MPIYTKKGDKGTAGLLGTDKRFPKSSLIFNVLGTIDEANSYLGLSASFTKEQYLKNKINQVQKTLFKLGSIIAGARFSIPKSLVTKYEKEIGVWTAAMPKLNSFILPGGSKAASTLFVARSVVRRLERLIVSLSDEQKVKPNLLVYTNRLSDYLFTLARYTNFREGELEVPWRGHQK
jgi:cob(I)alamin adenosyltransferase